MAAKTGTPPSAQDPAGRGIREDRLDCSRLASRFVARGIGGDLLRGSALGGAEAGEPVLAAGVTAEVAGHQDRVDLVARLQHRVRACITVRVHLARAREVDRVGDLGLRPQRVPQAGLGCHR